MNLRDDRLSINDGERHKELSTYLNPPNTESLLNFHLAINKNIGFMTSNSTGSIF